MSTVFDEDILIHHIAAPGLPGDGFTVVEATGIRDDLDSLLLRPVITELDDVPDVDASSPSDGNALIWDGSTSTWKPGAPATVAAQSGNAGTWFGPVDTFNFVGGLTATPTSGFPGIAEVKPVFGGTGTAATVSRSDHAHWVPIVSRVPISPGSYMSGGSRTLANPTATLQSRNECIVEVELELQIRGGDAGASYYTLAINIDGNVRTTPAGTNGLWCVQGVPKETRLKHSLLISNLGRNIPITAWIEWNGGGGFYTDRGDLEIKISYAR